MIIRNSKEIENKFKNKELFLLLDLRGFQCSQLKLLMQDFPKQMVNLIKYEFSEIYLECHICKFKIHIDYLKLVDSTGWKNMCINCWERCYE